MTTTTAPRSAFRGPFENQLIELADLMDWLWVEHGKSFVKAGDDKVYAFGGNGYVIVFDESKWEGLIELITPKAAVTLKPNEHDVVTVSGSTLDEESIKEVLADGVAGLRRHYEDRYWGTPKL